MTALAEVFARLTSDPSFADEIRQNPGNALRAFNLTASELARLEAALDIEPIRTGEYPTATD